MSNILATDRLSNILNKINFIEEVVLEFGTITQALDDEKMGKPSILMHLISIAEQFNKLKEDNEFKILENFNKDDLRGSYDIRNFIAHDYDGVNLFIVESVIREKLPKIKNIIVKLVEV